jgi:hypothetical protein
MPATFAEPLAAIKDYVIPKLHMMAYRDTDFVTLYWLDKNCRDSVGGGNQLKAPIQDQIVTSDIVNIQTGSEAIGTDKQQEFDQTVFDWAFYVKPVVGYNHEIEVKCGNSPQLVFNYWETKVKIAEKSLRYYLNYLIHNGGYTYANCPKSGKYVMGLKYHCGDYTTASNTTYGGMPVTDDGALDTHQDNTTTIITPNAMEDMWLACNQKTQIIITTAAQFSKVWAFMTAYQRFQTDSETAKAGFKNILFNTAPVVYDTLCTAAYMYFLSAGDGVNKYMYYHISPHWDFTFTDVAARTPQSEIRLGRYLWAGNLEAPGRRNMGMFSALA